MQVTANRKLERLLLSKIDDPEIRPSKQLIDDANTEYFPLMKGYPKLILDMFESILELTETNKDLVKDGINKIACNLISQMDKVGILNRDIEYNDFCTNSSEETIRNISTLLKNAWPNTKSVWNSRFRFEVENINEESHQELVQSWEFWSGLHDVYVRTVSDILELVRSKLGNQSMFLLLNLAAIKSKFVYDEWAKLSPSDLVRTIKKLLVSHGSEFTEEVNDDYVVINVSSCASGGMLLSEKSIDDLKNLNYVNERTNKSRLDNKYNYSSYCAHCIMWNEQLPISWYGKPFYQTIPDPNNPRSCSLVFHKDKFDKRSYNFIDIKEI